MTTHDFLMLLGVIAISVLLAIPTLPQIGLNLNSGIFLVGSAANLTIGLVARRWSGSAA